MSLENLAEYPRKKNQVMIVAEISANHGKNFNRVVKLIKSAKEAGADAVKFQTYTADTMTLNVNNKYFRINHPEWGGQTLYELYKKASTPWNWFKRIRKITEDLGIMFFSTSFDKHSVDLLEGLDVPLHKVASFELTDLELIEYVARTKKPLMLSCGMATLQEIRDAVHVAKGAGAKEIILLKCVSSYPARPEEMNLNTIAELKKIFNLSVGLSDHTLGIGVSIAAVSLGAEVVEKHFTLSRKISTPDSFFSLEPEELRGLVDNVRNVEKALGKVHFGMTKGEEKNYIFRRSLFAIADIKKGEIFSEKNIGSIRPGFGIKPKYLRRVLKGKARVNIKRGTPLNWKLID